MDMILFFGGIGILILIILFFLENRSDNQFHKEVQREYDIYNDIYDVTSFEEIIND